MKVPHQSIEIIRHILGSIDLSDVEERDQTPEERKEYCGIISASFPTLEKDIKALLHAQLLYASNQAEDWDKVIFARGTFNGMSLLLEKWRQAHMEHHARGRPDSLDETNPLPEISM